MDKKLCVKTLVATNLRWMKRKDLRRVLEIERLAFPKPWSEDDFLLLLRKSETIGLVIEDENELVVGFLIYQLRSKRLDIKNLAVDPDFHRLGCGSAMVEKLISKLCKERRRSIELMVSETNLPAQLFFKSLGFRAICIHDNYFNNGLTAYEMRYKV